MSLSSNNFSKETPTKSGNSFANADPTKGSGFVSSKPAKSDELFSGENTGEGPYGGDFPEFGNIYGQGQYGGLSHFKTTRTTPPDINHSA